MATPTAAFVLNTLQHLQYQVRAPNQLAWRRGLQETIASELRNLAHSGEEALPVDSKRIIHLIVSALVSKKANFPDNALPFQLDDDSKAPTVWIADVFTAFSPQLAFGTSIGGKDTLPVRDIRARDMEVLWGSTLAIDFSDVGDGCPSWGNCAEHPPWVMAYRRLIEGIRRGLTIHTLAFDTAMASKINIRTGNPYYMDLINAGDDEDQFWSLVFSCEGLLKPMCGNCAHLASAAFEGSIVDIATRLMSSSHAEAAVPEQLQGANQARSDLPWHLSSRLSDWATYSATAYTGL
ncbi:hypothetical protein B0H13DRAFT_2309565 [Mycena leptocephala]|nr:hypothetical protein B0H13DRAFT_2309565 [Mycena leptocephala]